MERVAAIDTSDGALEGEPDTFGFGSVLADALLGEGEWFRADLEALCDRLIGIEYPAGYQVQGFINGAREVLDAV